MIDFHNHVLPDVDDGPKTLEESINMLKHASRQGVTEIIQTVHFQHPKMDGKNVEYNYLNNKINDLQIEIDKLNLKIKMHLAAEVFYLPNLTEICMNPLVTIGNGKYMLIEFKSNIFPTHYEKEFYKLQLNGITPIIAHPERYRFVQNDIHIIADWINKGFIIQIDAGSLIGHFGSAIQKISQEMLKNGYLHLIGSDAHNSKKRNFCLREAYAKITLLKYNHLVVIFKENSRKLLNGENLKSINSQTKMENKSYIQTIINLFKRS